MSTPRERKKLMAIWIGNYMRKYATELKPSAVIDLLCMVTEHYAMSMTEMELLKWYDKLRYGSESPMKILMKASGLSEAKEGQ